MNEDDTTMDTSMPTMMKIKTTAMFNALPITIRMTKKKMNTAMSTAVPNKNRRTDVYWMASKKIR